MIIPKFENLAGYRNKSIRIDPQVYPPIYTSISIMRPDVGRSSCSVVLVDDPSNRGGLFLTLALAGSTNPGVWVKYVKGKAAYGEASGAENWGATGPFTGCRIEAGYNNGNKYLAHIAVESGSPGHSGEDSRYPWENEHVAGGAFQGSRILLRGKVEPSTGNQDAFVFVVWEGGELQATKVERKGLVTGGYLIDKVQKIINPVK